MIDKDAKLLFEAYKSFDKRGNKPRIDHDDKATMYGKPVKDMVPTVSDLDKKYGKPDKKKKVDEAESPETLQMRDSYKEKGQRREGLNMLSNVERFLASEGDAQSVAAVHQAIEKMYMQVANVVEGEYDREDRYDGIDPEPEYRRETDQDRYGYPGDR